MRQLRVSWAELILQRNVLDSRTGAMGWTVPPPALPPEHPEREAPFVEGDEVPLCDAPLRVAALFVAPEPARSRLTLEGAGTTQVAGLGTRIDDGHEVLAISELSAWLRPSGRPVCRVSMFEPRSAASAAGPETAAPPDASNEPTVLDSSITQVSDSEYVLSRALLERVLATLSEMMRLGRARPHQENGKVVGFKLTGLRDAGPLARLGLRSGDVLTQVNGSELTTPDSALAAYANLREADALTIVLIRNGQPRTLVYSVR